MVIINTNVNSTLYSRTFMKVTLLKRHQRTVVLTVQNTDVN